MQHIKKQKVTNIEEKIPQTNEVTSKLTQNITTTLLSDKHFHKAENSG